MATSTPDVYLLDTANSQVWRYPEAVTGYESSPAGWWDSNPPNLSHAIAMALDGTDLYIMQSDGSMLKYDYAVNPQKFVKPVLKPPLTTPIGFTTGKGLNYVWVADPAHGRILQLDKSGNYVRTYRSSSSGMNLHQILSISISPDGKTLYVLTNSKIFDFPTSP
jgi:sugar lactone lactonase YvrE